jgi:hypothetical protein
VTSQIKALKEYLLAKYSNGRGGRGRKMAVEGGRRKRRHALRHTVV